MEPSVPSGGRPAAFFDLDRTLIPGSSLFLLARGLRSRDVYRVRDLVRMAVQQGRFKLRGETEHSVAAVRREALSFIAGRDQAELAGWGREIATTEILPRVYPDVVRMIATHRAAGDKTYLVTATPTELAEPVAAALEMDHALGTRVEVDSRGRYTGALTGCGLLHGPAKAEAVVERAVQDGIDLARSHAYSDSINDRKLLEAVGQPHAVNPDKALLRLAVRHGWAVHELRPVRRQALVGVPPLLPVGALIGAGFAAGWVTRGRRAG